MKRVLSILLVCLFLLAGCQTNPTVPVYKTPNGTPFILPVDYDAEDTPAVTVLTGDAITDELRRTYYQFPLDWDTRYFTDFDYAKGELPAEDGLKYYSVKMDDYWLFWDLDGTTATMEGDKMNAPIDQRFDYSLYTAEDQVSYIPAESKKWIYQYGSNYSPVQELTEYRSVEYEDYTVISVKANDYYRVVPYMPEKVFDLYPGQTLAGLDQLAYDRYINEGLSYEDSVKDWIITGQADLLGDPDLQVEYTYMIKEGGEPIFLSYQMTILWDIISAYK